jgi:hypothetical protein
LWSICNVRANALHTGERHPAAGPAHRALAPAPHRDCAAHHFGRELSATAPVKPKTPCRATFTEGDCHAYPALPRLRLHPGCRCRRRPIDRGDAEDLKHDIAGEYRLETGRSVRLSVVDGTLYIDLNNADRKALHRVAPDLLASRDGSLTVEYLPEGSAGRIRILHQRFPAGQRLGMLHSAGR